MAGSECLLLLGTVLVQGNVQEDGREGTDWKRPTFGGRMVQHVCERTAQRMTLVCVQQHNRVLGHVRDFTSRSGSLIKLSPET